VVTDSAGTHTYSSSNFAVINGTDGNYTGTFTYTPAYPPTNPPYPVQFVVGNGGPDNPTILWATFGPADNSPDLGSSSPRSGCEGICGSPINLASGNTWIQRQDYSLPGLGGGLQLTRTWNSMWPDNFPFQQLGMFGDSWQSTYEEHIQTTQAGANYWRADGSAWEFTYNSQTKAYTLASPLDARASLSFSSHTALFTVVLLDGSQRIFNSAGYLTALIDRNGNQVTVAHDSSNRITQVTDPAGRVLTFNYAAPSFPNLVSSTQDAVGNIATYAYDASGHLTSVTYADGSVVSYSYDGTGVILSVTDSQGKILESHTYDYLRRGLASARANGADRIAVSYDSQAATLQDSSGNLTTYGTQRIATRNYVSSIAGSGCDTCGGRGNYAFTYDSQGNRLTSTDPLGHLTKFAYDSNGDVTQKQIQSDSTGTNFQTWKYTYNSFGEVLTATDPLGNVTTNTYDSKGNLLTTTTPSPGGRVSGSKTSFAYDTKGELTTITDPLSHSTTIAYYTTGLVKSTTDAQSKVTQYQYDARGNRTAIIDANNQQTSFTYDVMNRLTKITYPTSPATFTQFGYDYRGRKTSVTDSNSKVTQYAYDDADRLVSVTDPNNGIIQYAYDNESNLTSIIDAAGNKTSFQYDSYGHVSQTSFPSSLAETYSYDLAGNLLTKTDRNGHVINYGYDVLNRLTSKSYPDSTAVNYTYDLANRLAQVSDPTGTYGFTYDNRSRLTQTSTTYSAISGKTFAVKYGYDAASNRTSMTDPQNAATSYVYDALNRLTTLAYPTSANYSFSYDALGRRTQLTRPNGIATNYQYDSVSRLLSVLHQTGSTVLDGATYQYDAAGNRTSKTDKRTNVTSTFSYDPLYELTQVLQGSTTTESYSYDARSATGSVR
jgi:YD repeat-containing protein